MQKYINITFVGPFLGYWERLQVALGYSSSNHAEFIAIVID